MSTAESSRGGIEREVVYDCSSIGAAAASLFATKVAAWLAGAMQLPPHD